MTDDIYSKLIRSGRVSLELAQARKRLESGPYAPTKLPGASKGFLAGRVSRFKPFIRSTLTMTGMLRRGRRNARSIQVNHNELVIRRLPSSLEGYTLLQLSDVHTDIADDMSAVISDSIRTLNYDLCIVTGDFRADTKGPWHQAVECFAPVFKAITSPTYAVLGNHDCLAIADGLETLGVNMLMNEHAVIIDGEPKLALVGIDDPHYFATDDLERAVNGLTPDVIKLLLSHTPEPYLQAHELGIDYLFAGHTHGGQICLPGGFPVIVNADCPRAFCRGAWRYKSMGGYTSSGTGSSVIDVRFNCPPEVTLHRLTAG